MNKVEISTLAANAHHPADGRGATPTVSIPLRLDEEHAHRHGDRGRVGRGMRGVTNDEESRAASRANLDDPQELEPQAPGRRQFERTIRRALSMLSWAFYAMTGWTPAVSQSQIVGIGLVQGAGLGFLFVPLSSTSLATLSPEDRTEGAGVYNLARNIGSSVGISVVNALLTRNIQINHAEIVRHVTAVNRAFDLPAISQFWPTPGERHSIR